jgi:hypothetical protein
MKQAEVMKNKMISTRNNQLKRCISLYFNFCVFSEPQNPQKLVPHE